MEVGDDNAFKIKLLPLQEQRLHVPSAGQVKFH